MPCVGDSDGTTQLGEAMAIVVRHQLQHTPMLGSHAFARKSMMREEITRELINTCSVQYGIPPKLLLAAMHDRASSNNIAMRTVKVVYPFPVDVGCFFTYT